MAETYEQVKENNKNNHIRLLRADEIEIRPSVVRADGLSLLLYGL